MLTEHETRTQNRRVARGLGGSHTDSREYSGSRQIPSESLVVVVRWFKVADDDGRRSGVARAARHGLDAGKWNCSILYDT